ncbi:MAG: chorismate-binding protein [Bacteriovoracaceae bacterium]
MNDLLEADHHLYNQGAIFAYDNELYFGTESDQYCDFRINAVTRDGKSINSKCYRKGPLPLNAHNSWQDRIKSSSFNDQRFIDDYNIAKDLIEAKQLNKAVIYNTYEIELDKPFNVFELSLLRKKIPHNTSLYGFWKEDQGLIGLSPELLFEKQENNSFKTCALAGTSLDETELLGKANTNEEQQTVFNHFESIFQKKNWLYQVSPKSTLSFGKLKHIHQEIVFHYYGKGDQLVSELAPTPAVGVFPSDKLKETWNNFNFNHLETPYAGTFHFESQSHDKAIVMIRALEWKKNIVSVHAGCGIVKDSILHEEIEESHNKIKTVLDYFK